MKDDALPPDPTRDFGRSESADRSSVYCPCGSSFSWGAFDDGLEAWCAEHRPHLDPDAAPPTPRVAEAAVTRPTPEALRASRREPTDEPGPLGAPRVATGLGDTPSPTSGPRVLIVDDDPDIRIGLRALLEENGYMVAEAENGVEGLRRLFSMWPRCDLVLLDLMMPKMNGLDFLSVQQVSEASDVPVIIVSGYPRRYAGELDDSFVFLKKGDLGDTAALLGSVRRHIEEGRDRRRNRSRP